MPVLFSIACGCFSLFADVAPVSADLLVVGGGEAACAAAVQAARMGVTNVILVSDCAMLGGQYSAEGVGAVDERIRMDGCSIDFPRSGLALEISDAIEAYNLRRYGRACPGNCWSATHTIEPHPATEIFERLLAAEGSRIRVLRGHHVEEVLRGERGVHGVRFSDGLTVRAKLTVDASDWGDVIRLGGARYYCGVDPHARFGEPSAPETIGPVERQEMNPVTWTLTLRKHPGAKPIARPPGYATHFFEPESWRPSGILPCTYTTDVRCNPYIQRRLVDCVNYRLHDAVETIQLNATCMDYPLCLWPAHVAARLRTLGAGLDKVNFVELPRAAKEIVFADAKDRALSYLYFLQWDNPATTNLMCQFELTDEFGTADRLPPKIYIREGCRLAAMTMLTENEVKAKNPLKPRWMRCPDDAAFGFQFHIDFHPTRRSCPSAARPTAWRPKVASRDWNSQANRSFVPYSAFVPEAMEGLLGAGRNIGVSSIVQAALRLHPQMVLSGQCAGALAATALSDGRTPRGVVGDPKAVTRLQERMVRGVGGKPGVAVWAWQNLKPGDRDFIIANLPVVRKPPRDPADFVWRGTASGPTASDPYDYKALVSTASHPTEIRPGLFDFGRDGIGWLEIQQSPAGRYEIVVGEMTNALGHVTNAFPKSSIRCHCVCGDCVAGSFRLPVPQDPFNLKGWTPDTAPAILVPDEFGTVYPFRYAEIVRFPGAIRPRQLVRHMVHYPMDMTQSSFSCDNSVLDEICEFCKYSILETSFCGLYVDGDRERTPYEADAYVNQLSQYAIDADYSLARKSHEWLMEHPTWPTEWKQLSIFLAWNDWMWTGDTRSLKKCYPQLKRKLLGNYPRKDIVDWPEAERDGFAMTNSNAVVDAFNCRNLEQMADMAGALGETADAAVYRGRARAAKEKFLADYLDARSGLVADSVEIRHFSLHANAAALAFGLVPKKNIGRVVAFLEQKGMACSVYFAQYLLEAFCEAGRADLAIRLMASDGRRSWKAMMDFGSTVTMEAWDMESKPNQDLNHAWGTAPLNIISRYVLGVTPLEPGFARISVKPQIGGLKRVDGVVPTARGSVRVSVADGSLSVSVPASARIVWRGKTRDVSAGDHCLGPEREAKCD